MTLPEPAITEKIALKLAGMVYFGNPVHSHEGWNVENEIGKLWNRFMTLCTENAEVIGQQSIEPGVAYEAHIAYPGKVNQEYHIFVGIETENPFPLPIELFYKVMPSTRYAVFTVKCSDMFEQMEELYSEWLPNSPFVESYPMLIQRYDMARYKGLDDPDSEIDFMLPIKERDDEG